MMKTILLLSLLSGALAQVPSICPPGWQSKDDRCYFFAFYPQLPYDEAALECQRNGAILLTVETMQEHNFIINNLKSDFHQREWYTSAERDTSDERTVRYVWTATNQELPLNSPFWALSQTPIFNEDKTMNLVVYLLDRRYNSYGLGLTSNRKELRSYICEISRNEVYRINTQGRKFDYGISTRDRYSIPRGPRIISQTGDTNVIGVSKRLFLDCVATGMPQPSFYWTRTVTGTTESITAGLDSRYTVTNGRLTIEDPVENKDAGLYQCGVSNDVGTVIGAPIQLAFASVGEFPNIPPAPVRPKRHEGAAIECPELPTKLAQDLRYQWTKCFLDDQECINNFARKEFIRPDLNTYIFNSGIGKLFFSEVTDADNGYYYCVATLTNVNENNNYEGAAQPPAKTSRGILLNVTQGSGGEFHPVIQNGFINVFPGSPLEGKNVRLECFAYGTGPLYYSWNIPHKWNERYGLEDSNRILRIDNLQLEDSGTYECVVLGKTGSRDSTTYTLNVEAKPRFLLELQDQHLDEGTRQLTWRCEARAVPFPLYTWYKNGEKIQNSTSGDVMVVRNTLMLTNLNMDMEGMYQCAANNSLGVTFSSARLRILSLKPTFDKNPMSKTMAGAVGGNITIPCRPEAAPFPVFTWFHNGGNMNLGMDRMSRQWMTINGDLEMRELTTGDQGQYECQVENVHGKAKNSTYLSLVRRTTIYQNPIPTTIEVNRTAYMYCTASFHYSLDLAYQWAFNGRIINFVNHEHYRRGDPPNTGGLYIRFAQVDHAGTYTCIAKTQVDSANASATLQVLAPPPEVAGVAAYKRNDASQTMTEGLALGTRDVVLRWSDPIKTHGAPIDGYQIFGQTNYSDTWHTLFPNVPHPQTTIPGYIDGQRRQYVVPGLKAGVSYQFKIRAINRFGVGKESKPTSKVVIPGSAPDVPPKSVGGGGGSVGTLKITWDPLPPEDQNGWGIGYIVEWRLKPPPGEQERNIGWTTEEVKGNVGEFSTTIGDDNYFLAYNVKITPFNIHGNGVPAYNDTVYSAEGMPIGIPGRVYAEPFNESALTVHWIAVPNTRAAMKGRLKGYKINYWLKDVETQEEAKQSIIYNQTDHARIIGLHPDTWYTVTVIAFNNAGNGLKSEVAHQQTDRSAPLHYPVNIEVFPHSADSVRVTFRGVSTGIWEEPLLGYKIRYWRDSDNIRNAIDVDCEKSTEGIIYQIQQDTLYHLRVLGYSLGGDGKMSSPQTLFSLMRNRVTQVNWDPSTTEVIYVYHDMSTGGGLSSKPCSILIVLLILLAQWILRKT